MEPSAQSELTEPSAGTDRLHVAFDDWQTLAESEDPATFLRAWLSIICDVIGDVQCASVLLENGEEGFQPAANWPDATCDLDTVGLNIAREATVKTEALIEESADAKSLQFAYPLVMDDGVAAVVAMQVAGRDDDALDAILQQLQIGSAWIELLFRRQQSDDDQALVGQAISSLSILNRVAEHTDPLDAANELVTSLASELSCERVMYGRSQRTRVEVVALSNSGQFGRKMNLMRLADQAMLEALDQDRVINFSRDPDTDSEQPDTAVTRHQRLSEESRSGAILTVPIVRGQHQIGAVLLERGADQRFSTEEQALVETLAEIAGRTIDDKFRSSRSLPSIASSRLGGFLSGTLRMKHPLRTLLLLGIAGFVVASALIEKTFEVRADGKLEGLFERAVVAPFDGYIEFAGKRVGDRVDSGELLGRIDTSDFELELVDLESKKSQALNQIREAQASGNRAQVNIVQSQADQVDAQIAQLEARIARTELVAPYAGTIVHGDLSRQLGAAVTRGEVLFEVAPLDAYRVALQVDERDIGFVEPGATANLVLASRTSEVLTLNIDRITPVARAAEGRNTFRTEAILNDPDSSLRPGMEGVARIAAGERSLLWIWTRDFVNWLRLAVWRWLP